MDIPDLLINALYRREVMLFVGAGLSVGAGLPGWVQLVDHLANKVDMPWPEDKEYITTDHLLTAIKCGENQLGRNSLIQYFIKELDTTLLDPTSVHYLLTLLPFRVIVTTNYDDLIERSFQKIGVRYHTIVYKKEFAYWGEDSTQILKLCGDIFRPDSLIVTKNDFSTYRETHATFINQLRTLLETKTALFLGYSLRDPFFNQIWDTIRLSFADHHRLGYAVFFESPKPEVDELRVRGIQVINLQTGDIEKTEVMKDWLTSLIDRVSIRVDIVDRNKINRVSDYLTGNEIIKRLSEIEQKIDEGFSDNRKIASQILELVTKNKLDKDEISQIASEVRAWANDLKAADLSVDERLDTGLKTLSQHTGDNYHYLQLALPIIPGILSYNLELGNQNQIDLKVMLDRIKTWIKKSSSDTTSKQS